MSGIFARNKRFIRSIVILSVLAALFLCLFACGVTGGETTMSISVQEDFRTKYFIGQSFSPTGSLKVFHDIDYYSIVPIDASMVDYSAFDSSEKGDCVVVVSYQGLSVKVPIRIVEVKALSIKFDEDTLPSVLYKDEPFPSGITFTAEMEDGTTRRQLPLLASYLDRFDASKEGDQTIAVTYAGKVAELTVTVKENEVESLTLYNVTSKNTEYTVDTAKPCVDDVKCCITYENGKYFLVALTHDMVVGFDATSPGDHEATVTFDDLTCPFPYHVSKAPVLVLDENMLSVMEKGAAFSGSGTVIYGDDTRKTFSLSAENAPQYDSMTVGEHEVTVTVDGVSAKYRYTVLPDIVTHAVTYTKTVKVGTAFDYNGELYIEYETGDSETLSLRSDRLAFTLERFDTTGNVEQTLRLQGRTFEASMPVYVCSEEEWNSSLLRIDVEGEIKRELAEGDTLTEDDFVGIKVILVYLYLDRSDTLPLDPSWVTVAYPAETMTEDHRDLTVTISYGGKENTDLSVKMLSKAFLTRVTGLTLLNYRGVYAVGDALPLDEMALLVEYGDGYDYIEEPANSAAYEGYASAEPTEDGSFSVTYKGYSAEYRYRIISREDAERADQVEVFGFEPDLHVGDTIEDLSVEGVRLVVTYGGGYRTDTLAATALEGGPFTEEGPVTVVVISGDIRANCIVNVSPARA